MGFEEALCKEALKFTNDQEKAIELIFQFQEERGKGAYPKDIQVEKDVQQEDNIFDTMSMMDSYKLVFLVRNDLGMSCGEIATQVGHAVIGAYQAIIKSTKIPWREDLFQWEDSGTAKIVLQVNSKDELTDLFTKARDQGLNTYLVSDSQIEMGGYTVCAVGPSKSTVIDKITGHLKLL
jgi:PTH2 family peptidyl-tRNA hydrolase